MMWHVDILNIYQKYKQSMTKHYVIRHFTLLVIHSMPDINVDWRQCSTNSLKRRLKIFSRLIRQMKFRIYENQKLTIELPTLFTRNFRKHKIYFENIISGIQFNDEQYQRKLQF